MRRGNSRRRSAAPSCRLSTPRLPMPRICTTRGVFVKKVPSLAILQHGSPLIEVDQRIQPLPGEKVVEKKYASAFFGTSLDIDLRLLGIDTVILAGCTTSGCIRASAVDSLQYGYHTIVVREAVGDRAAGPHEANLFDIDAKYGDVVILRTRSIICSSSSGKRRFRGQGAGRFRSLVAPRPTRLSLEMANIATTRTVVGLRRHARANQEALRRSLSWRAHQPVRLPRRLKAVLRQADDASSACRRHPRRLDADSPAARRLNERFGDDWRFEIAEQTRDGDEAIVLCKLIFGKDGAVRTQFGRARISGAGCRSERRRAIQGRRRGRRPDERDAFRRAAEAALMNCVDLI